jgi:flagellar hook assembly protein FlgD
LAARKSDGVIVVGTHGRGAFKGTTGTTSADDNQLTVKDYSLEQNYPNPFNPTTTISFVLPANENVKLEIFNSNGELVTSLIDNNLNAGSHTVKWNATNSSGVKLASGIYLYKLTAGSFVESKKMMLLK